MSRTIYSNTHIASPLLAAGRVGPFDMSLNGQPVLDVFHYFGAANATVLEHGDGPVELEYSVTRLFSSEADMLLFVATHREALPRQADHIIIDDDEARALVLEDAVRSVTFSQLRGASCLVRYKFTGSRMVSDDVPDEPVDTDFVKAINQALTAASAEQAIVFDVPFASAPRGISLQLSAPDGGTMIGWQIRESTRTAAGFTVDFDNLVPAVGYKLTGIAVL